MPRRLDSVNQGGHYVEALDVVENELESVVSMLGITEMARGDERSNRLESPLNR